MGIFSSKKTLVASTAYNMAGPEEDRVNYLKTTVVGNVLLNSQSSISEAIVGSHLKGPGIKMRSFYRWALINYGLIGVPPGVIGNNPAPNFAAVAAQVPVASGTVVVQDVGVGAADYSWWADQYMLDNHPTLLDTSWTSDFNDTTETVTITFADLTTYSFSIVTTFNKASKYVYVTYNVSSGSVAGSLVTGAWTVITPETDPFPGPVGADWVDGGTTNVAIDPPDPVTGATLRSTHVWSRVTYLGVDPATGNQNQKTEWYYEEETSLSGTVKSRQYRTDYRIDVLQNFGPTKIYIYEMNTGNTVLDDLGPDETNDEGYLPFIPLRIKGNFLSNSYEPTAYDLAVRAYKKATGMKYDEMIEKLADNEDLGEIDYAYVVFGVSLNCVDNAARKYIYNLFDKLMTTQGTTAGEFSSYLTNQNAYDTAMDNWITWKEAQENSADPLYGTAAPTVPAVPSQPINQIQVKANGAFPSNYNVIISWLRISKTTGTGLGKAGAKRGDVWMTVDPNPIGSQKSIYVQGASQRDDHVENTTFSIWWQNGDSNWSKITVYGGIHRNLIYDGKSVVITPKEALEDAEESGFIIPIHFETMKELSLVDATQMQTACTYLVLNSYDIVKKPWYALGIFKILLFIVVIALAIIFPPFGAAGTAFFASIGAAIGLTGLAAIIAGIVITQLAAMILMKLIMIGAVEVFGAKFGAIIGSIIAVTAVMVGNGLLAGQSMTAIWGSMSSAANIIQLTQAAGNGVAGYMQAAAAEFAHKSEEIQTEYNKQSKEIKDLYEQNIGYGNGMIDPTMLTNFLVESEESFLNRTLLTGSDIAEMSMDMITNFSEFTVSTRLY